MKSTEEKEWDRNSHQGRRRDQVEFNENANFYVMLGFFIAVCTYYGVKFILELI